MSLIRIPKHETNRLYFSADHHFNHDNIIEFEDRPFNTAKDMGEELIKAWNEKVPLEGIVFYLGDLIFGDKKIAFNIIRQLNGHINILDLIWHHDRHWLHHDVYNSASGPLKIISPMALLEIVQYNENGYPLPITLSHYPMGVWDRSHYGAWCLHGHSHGHYTPVNNTDLILDVGVDLSPNFSPFSFDEIEKLMYNRKHEL